MSSWRERESETQARSREDNETTARAGAGEPGRAPLTSFRCECGDEACTCAIRLTAAEYESVREAATHFAIAPNHENPESEQLIEEHGRFTVVESISREAVHVARERNPRQWHEHTSQADSEVALLNVPWQGARGGPSPRSCPVCDRRVLDDRTAVHHGGELYHPGCRHVRRERP